jgi:hypothetical protein
VSHDGGRDVLLSHRSTVLGVDQATSSGYCLHSARSPVRWGKALTAFDRRAVLEMARAFASEVDQPWFVFVYEDHTFANGQRGHGTLIGQLHRWLEQLDLMGHPRELRLGVTPNAWQCTVLGCKPNTKRAERKAQSLAWASAHVHEPVTDDDVSDAIALSCFGTLDGLRMIEQRRYKLPKPLKKVRKPRARVI